MFTVIHNDIATCQPNALSQKVSKWARFRIWLSTWWVINVSRRIPHLVWRDQEIDVRITFKNDCLPGGQEADEAFLTFYSGALAEARRKLHEAGIDFDTGMGCEGRDWEWDFSLRGPVSVTFKSKASRPERRVARPRPVLASVNSDKA